ncbi:tetratricopeptide repeat protein [Helicobacter baculiformis]|uniref:beta-lactamase n=1 Tax=Helicobacter baculiformis TaxID=427351 RepID=A0ABV7ZIR7_9HELI|nr:tetratricopeptide repeat protein [Helicobacter baculiformis]
MKGFFAILFMIGALGAQATLLEQAEAAYKRKGYLTAFKLYKQGAQRGEAQAIYHLGLMYRYGQWVDLDYKKAIKYFEKAGKMGVVDAYLELAHMAEDTKGGLSCKKPLIYYQKALDLDQNRADIYADFGRFYVFAPFDFLCFGVELSKAQENQYHQKGVSYLEKAGEMGDFNAYTTLGYKYLYGAPGFTRSHKIAKQYYLKAVAVLEKAGTKGDSQAYNELGLLYQDYDGSLSTETILENGHKAVAYFQKAVAMGNAHAYVHMGEYYENGGFSQAVQVDKNKAMEYYKKAGELGDAQGYAHLANLYQTMAPENSVEALKKVMEYLKAAGDLGDDSSYNQLGDIYYYGGLERNENDPSAAHIPRDYKKAAHYYKKCADMGNGYCYVSLSDMYEKGLGVPKDRKKARAYAHHGSAIICDIGEESACEGDGE